MPALDEGQQDAAAVLARYAASVSYDGLPEEVVAALRNVVLDTLGAMLAANTLGTGIREMVNVARSTAGPAESTIIGFGDRVSAPMAAWVNGAMAHSLNYDGAHAGAHVGAATVPCALAAAERAGGASGKEFLAALAAGGEVICRIAAAVLGAEDGTGLTRAPRPLRVQLWAYFGAAASAGRMMGLTGQQMHSALGLALMQGAGNWQSELEGVPAKIYTSFPSLSGMLAALLSKQGLRMDCAVFDGQAGLFASLYDGKYRRPPLVEQLGQRFLVANTRLKPWPTTGVAHPYIEAALQLAASSGLDSRTIAALQIKGGPGIRHHLEPAAERKSPSNGASAGDSIFFAVAKALANGGVTLGDFAPAGLAQPEALELAQKMEYTIDPALAGSAIIEITTASGEHYTSRVDSPQGDQTTLLSTSQQIEKFVDCARYAEHPLSADRVRQIVELVDHFETLPDVTVLPALLSGYPE